MRRSGPGCRGAMRRSCRVTRRQLLRAGAVIITEARAACGRGMLRVKKSCVSLLVLFLKSPIPHNLALHGLIQLTVHGSRIAGVRFLPTSPYPCVAGGDSSEINCLKESSIPPTPTPPTSDVVPVLPRRLRVLINDTWTSRLWPRGDCGCSRSCVRH